MKQTGGVMTVFLTMPAVDDCGEIYGSADIDPGGLALMALTTGSWAYSERADLDGQKLVIKFRRSAFDEPIGTAFMLYGTFLDEDGPAFAGFDAVMKNPPQDQSGESPEPAGGEPKGGKGKK